jgi:hypothetical protein
MYPAINSQLKFSMQPPDPGKLPCLPAPNDGEMVVFEVDGLPPYKERNASIRNPKHRFYSRFILLREAATKAMAGRRWFDGPIQLHVIIRASGLEDAVGLNDYIGGIMDSLDGSHGTHFTYLPIVYQDDCQVSAIASSFSQSTFTNYRIQIIFGTSLSDCLNRSCY